MVANATGSREVRSHMGNTRKVAVGSLTMRDDGILHVVFDFDTEPTREAAAEYMAARSKIAGTPPPPVIVEILQIPFVERATRQSFMNELVPPPCRAIVVTDPTFDTNYRAFELVNPASVPTRVFRQLDDAVSWIRGLMEQD